MEMLYNEMEADHPQGELSFDMDHCAKFQNQHPKNVEPGVNDLHSEKKTQHFLLQGLTRAIVNNYGHSWQTNNIRQRQLITIETKV